MPFLLGTFLSGNNPLLYCGLTSPGFLVPITTGPYLCTTEYIEPAPRQADMVHIGTKAGCTNVWLLLDCVVNHIGGNDSVCV